MPVGYAGRLFHENKGGSLLQAADEVVSHGHSGVGIHSVGIVVPGGKVQIFRPFLVIQGFIKAHEVGGDRDVGGYGFYSLVFRAVIIQHGI